MSNNVYSEINLHFVWPVKQSLPLISETIEPRLHRFLRRYALKTKDLIFHEVGGTETHVHIAVTIPPTLPIAEWIGKLKGASSHYVNHELVNRKVLDWQRGHGVVSFGTKDLQWVINYIRNQKPFLERTYLSACSSRGRSAISVSSFDVQSPSSSNRSIVNNRSDHRGGDRNSGIRAMG